MTSIDRSTALAAQIRAQIGAQFRARAARDPGAPPGRPTTAGAPPSVQTLMALRVKALSPDDPQRQRKAFRIFLESVLLQELGSERIDAASFDTLVATVLGQMEHDEALNTALLAAGAHLLAEADGGPAAPGPVLAGRPR